MAGDKNTASDTYSKEQANFYDSLIADPNEIYTQDTLTCCALIEYILNTQPQIKTAGKKVILYATRTIKANHSTLARITTNIKEQLIHAQPQQSATTYAAALSKSQQPPQATSPQEIPPKPAMKTVVIKPVNKTAPAMIDYELKEHLKTTKNKHKLNSIKYYEKAVVLKLASNSAPESVVNEFNNNPKLSKLGTAYTPKALDPTIVIKNISTDTELDTLTSQICNNNEELTGLKDEMRFMFALKDNTQHKTISLAFRVSPKVFHIISHLLNFRVYLDSQCCQVRHQVFVRQCQKCFSFHHNTKECTEKAQCCNKCSEEKTPKHKCTTIRCLNCAVKGIEDKDHLANKKECPLYAAQTQRIMEQTAFR